MRHHHVQHDGVGPVGRDGREGLGPVGGEADLVPLEPQRPLERVPHRGLVVDHEDLHALIADVYRSVSRGGGGFDPGRILAAIADATGST